MLGNIIDQNMVVIIFLTAFIAAASVFFYVKKIKIVDFSNTPILNSFSRDLTELAKKGQLDPVIGREEEIEHLIMVLSRRTKNNAVLIGKAGVGKTTIVEGLAQKIAEKNAPGDLLGKRVLALDINSLLAGTKYRGEFEQRVKKITEELEASQRNIILFVDEIQDLVEAESSGESISVGDIFKPAMARGDLQIVGATTPEDYENYFNRDQAFKRRLQPIMVHEPNDNETLKILEGIRGKYESYHKVKITDKALIACVQESKKLLPERSFPDKAIDLMDETASKVRIDHLKNTEDGRMPEVGAGDISAVANEYEKENNQV
jgi:ATP-dependent Clp protease ATP-binding subunit ClpC